MVREIAWLRMLLKELGYAQTKPTPIFIDNRAAIFLAYDAVNHKRTKHIDIRYHYIREHVERNKIQLIPIASKDNIADVMTKPTSNQTFNRLVNAGKNVMQHLREQDSQPEMTRSVFTDPLKGCV